MLASIIVILGNLALISTNVLALVKLFKKPKKEVKEAEAPAREEA